ncbi:hypothetical protein K474DRAFT_1713859 [Panus rudis PR-1116 ss-1]|nr:hypothetical protein K474DRAFT_1713859 [Panus rudis PR-1116 ss-1]
MSEIATENNSIELQVDVSQASIATGIGNCGEVDETDSQGSSYSAVNEEDDARLNDAEREGRRTESAVAFQRSIGTTRRRVKGVATYDMDDPDPLLTLRDRVELLEQQMARLSPKLNRTGQEPESVMKIAADHAKSMLQHVWVYAIMLTIAVTIAALMAWSFLVKDRQPEETLSSLGECPLWQRMHSELRPS